MSILSTMHEKKTCSRGKRQPEGIPGCIWDQQGEDAANPSNQARSGAQLLGLLLWDP